MNTSIPITGILWCYYDVAISTTITNALILRSRYYERVFFH